MQVGRDWIEFAYKPPISSVTNRLLSVDFLVIALCIEQHEYIYKIMQASSATELYNQDPKSMIAWKAFEEYTPSKTPKNIDVI